MPSHMKHSLATQAAQTHAASQRTQLCAPDGDRACHPQRTAAGLLSVKQRCLMAWWQPSISQRSSCLSPWG